MEEEGIPKVEAAGDFGAVLRAWRSTSLRRLADKQLSPGFETVLSKSQLHRYETGASLPSLEMARHLDRLYGANGWIELAARSIFHSSWSPWRDEQRPPTESHFGQWPATYHGVVWVKVLPHPGNIGKQHQIRLDWGPWTRSVVTTLDERGVVLLTGKATDLSGLSTTCNVVVDLPVFTLFGAGASLAHEVVHDIGADWTPISEL